jgi:hypothetical protein
MVGPMSTEKVRYENNQRLHGADQSLAYYGVYRTPENPQDHNLALSIE